jgi:hypothetical protein
MPENRVSATILPEDLEAIQAAIATLKEKLPFLLSLTTEESKSLLRLGDKSRAFVAKTLEFASQHPEILPTMFDLQEMEEDLSLFEALYPIQMALTELTEQVTDTMAVAGSEAYAAARLVYSYAKAGNLDGELEPYLEDLGKRFRRARAKRAESSGE